MEDIFDDISARFILNLPEEDLSSYERLGFQVEQAYWFYLDFYRDSDTSLPKYKLMTFARELFKHCPSLHSHQHECDIVIEKFTTYKKQIPVCGSIILNQTMDRVLLVCGFTSRTWSFPRGKIGKDEDFLACAIREVYEETGFDVTDFIDPKDFLVVHDEGVPMRLFIARGVPENTEFIPRMKGEIRDIKWFDIKNLPDESVPNGKTSEGKFWKVSAFLNGLGKWVKKQRKKERRQEKLKNELRQLLGMEDTKEPKPSVEVEAKVKPFALPDKVLSSSGFFKLPKFKFNVERILLAFE